VLAAASLAQRIDGLVLDQPELIGGFGAALQRELAHRVPGLNIRHAAQQTSDRFGLGHRGGRGARAPVRE
jgi:hypothetical protein